MFDIDLEQFANNTCLITKDEVFSYSDVIKASKQIEEVLPKQKQLIVFLCQMDIETIIGYIASLRANHACMMLDASLDKALLDTLIDTYKPNFIYKKSDEDDQKTIFRYKNYSLIQHNTSTIELNPKLSLLLSTSGTTGSPKMVTLSKDNLYANCQSITEYLQISSNDRVITTLPFHYSYGLSVLHTHLAKGASIVVTPESVISRAFWDSFKKYEVTTFNGVPYHYEMLRRIKFFDMDLPSLKVMTQAGGKLNHTIAKEFALWAKEHNVKFFIMYGQTEATARIAYLPYQHNIDKAKSIGIAIPKGKLSIKDIDTQKIIDEAFKEGELYYQGDNVMIGYASSLKDLQNTSSLNGTLQTGDLAYKDEDGFFYISGRLKRFIKVHGKRINLDEIEHFLKSKGYRVLCTGDDDTLMVATQDDNLQEIQKLLIDTYALHHSTIKIKHIDTFPVTPSGKIKYSELKKAFV